MMQEVRGAERKRRRMMQEERRREEATAHGNPRLAN